MKIVWDEPKRQATLFARGLDFAMVTPAFFSTAKIQPAKKDRFLGLGLIDGRAYAVVFKVLGSCQRQGKAHLMTRKAEKRPPPTEAEIAARDVARGFTDADLADVMDNPEWTDEQLRHAKPFAEVFPDMAAAMKPARRASKP